MTTGTAQSPSRNAMAPGRGGGPGACMSEAFGGNRARRGNGPFKESCGLSPLPSLISGLSEGKKEEGIVHNVAAKTHKDVGNQINFFYAARTSSIFPELVVEHARAKATNSVRENGLSNTLYSGCHWTPITNRAPGRLTASICPSGATASTNSGGAGRSMPCECRELTMISPTPNSANRRPPGIRLTLCAGP